MRILVVDDETDVALSLEECLTADGFDVRVAHDGAAGLATVATWQPDVVVLDRDLPVLGGDAVCEVLTSAGSPTRVLMLTASASVRDRVEGLELGADDYLGKPFAYVELLARIRALGRRVDPGGDQVYERSGIRLDTGRRTAERDGREIHLTPKELDVLRVLLAADGGYVSTGGLLDEAWDGRTDRHRSVVKVTVHGLRSKLGAPPVVETGTGLGYRIA